MGAYGATFEGILQGRQNQQRIDIEKQQAQRAAEDWDRQIAEHMQSVGALPVQSNMVKQLMTVPGPSYQTASNSQSAPSTDSGNASLDDAASKAGGSPPSFTNTPSGASTQVPIIRKAGGDGRQIISHKTASGEKVQWELPTPEEQAQTHAHRALAAALLGQPVADIQAQQAGAMKRSEAYGQEAGKEAAVPRVPITPEYGQDKGLPPAMGSLPETMLPAVVRPWWAYQGTQAKVEGANQRNENTVEGANERNQSNIDARKATDDAKRQFVNEQNKRKLGFQDRWAKARNALTAASAGGVQSRFQAGQQERQLREFDKSQKSHGALLDQMYQEQQRALEAQPLLDEKATPDGAEFVDPWSGKKQTMNYAQRLRMQNGAQASEKQVKGWQSRADALAQKFGLNGQQATAPAKPAAAAAAQAQHRIGDVVMGPDNKRYKVTAVNGSKVRVVPAQ